MSSTLLEVTRTAHEEVEWLNWQIVKDLQSEPSTNKERLRSMFPSNLSSNSPLQTSLKALCFHANERINFTKRHRLRLKLTMTNNRFCWLYKLHGLGQEFNCEICGNHSYWGRRAFERHFKAWRHQHGMLCMGIPNTKNFNEITYIKEAQELWEKIQEKQGLNKWRPDLKEEYEDKEGNIYNKKTYTDLQRQGLNLNLVLPGTF